LRQGRDRAGAAGTEPGSPFGASIAATLTYLHYATPKEQFTSLLAGLASQTNTASDGVRSQT